MSVKTNAVGKMCRKAMFSHTSQAVTQASEKHCSFAAGKTPL